MNIFWKSSLKIFSYGFQQSDCCSIFAQWFCGYFSLLIILSHYLPPATLVLIHRLYDIFLLSDPDCNHEESFAVNRTLSLHWKVYFRHDLLKFDSNTWPVIYVQYVNGQTVNKLLQTKICIALLFCCFCKSESVVGSKLWWRTFKTIYPPPLGTNVFCDVK